MMGLNKKWIIVLAVIIIILILGGAFLYFKQDIRFSPRDEVSFEESSESFKFNCKSYPDPGYRCDTKGRIKCVKGELAYCKCDGSFWTRIECPIGNTCENGVGCVGISGISVGEE